MTQSMSRHPMTSTLQANKSSGLQHPRQATADVSDVTGCLGPYYPSTWICSMGRSLGVASKRGFLAAWPLETLGAFLDFQQPLRYCVPKTAGTVPEPHMQLFRTTKTYPWPRSKADHCFTVFKWPPFDRILQRTRSHTRPTQLFKLGFRINVGQVQD